MRTPNITHRRLPRTDGATADRMDRGRYLKAMVIGIVATAAAICGIYTALVATDVIADFSWLAMGAAALIAIPGGAILGLLIASDADPGDD